MFPTGSSSSSGSGSGSGPAHGVQGLLLAVVVLAACLLSLQQHGAAAQPSLDFLFKAPGDDVMSLPDDNACYHDGKVEELCQRCAKLTKSNVVYPMCCEDREAAREWCDRYLHFGREQ